MTAYGLAVLDALQVLHTSWCDQMMVCITSLGNAGAVWIVFAVVLLLRRRTRAIGIYCILALLLSFLCCNLILKPLLMRPRPFLFSDVELLVATPHDYSFPSGHAASSFSAATAISACGKRMAIAVYALAAAIAFSRLYLYLHFPGDVAAGVLLGICCGLLARRLGKNFAICKEDNQHR